MHKWRNHVEREPEIYQLISSSCHLTPSEKWAREKYTAKAEWFTQAKFPVQQGLCRTVAFLLKHGWKHRDLSRRDSLFPLQQPLFPPPACDSARLGWEPQYHWQLSPGCAFLQQRDVGEGDYWAIIHCLGSGRIMLQLTALQPVFHLTPLFSPKSSNTMCWLHMKFLLSLPVGAVIMSQIHFSHSHFICWPDLAIIAPPTSLNRAPSAQFSHFFPLESCLEESLDHHLPLAKVGGMNLSYESKLLAARTQSATETTFQLALHFSGLKKDAVTNILIHVN